MYSHIIDLDKVVSKKHSHLQMNFHSNLKNFLILVGIGYFFEIKVGRIHLQDN